MADMLKRIPVREQDAKVRATNFEEVCYGYNKEEAMEEATRCLNCKNARCIQGCPVSINIPGFISKLKEGDIMATVQTLDNIRLSLKKHLGKRIILKANKGRKQVMTRRGILENVYPSVFIVKLEASGSGYQRVSYSYSDLLTENVKLQVFKESKKAENELSVS